MQLEGEGAKAPPGEGERISEPTKSYFPAQLSAINGEDCGCCPVGVSMQVHACFFCRKAGSTPEEKDPVPGHLTLAVLSSPVYGGRRQEKRSDAPAA
ncbi:hypothetical protein SUGI_1513970 [Cryptomeria japonica]|uniref:Uncharacterized protein n=1 Tax=Cryptomeria japonica TaxID=3369 RepID=A0AAD3NU84_CRYJA|nr:hypothetical protein SUGI_1485360 [Cryptomeria japonica]GLJ59554.1 hypothetical protein SUGI_1513970 [Cryptomeria japonica]